MIRSLLKTAIAPIVVIGLAVLVWGQAPGGEKAPSVAPSTGPGPSAKSELAPTVKAKADKALAAGTQFLRTSLAKDESWMKMPPAVAAMMVKALVQAGQPIDSAEIKKALAFILAQQSKTPGKTEGAFSERMLANYNTAICVSTLVLLNQKLPGKPYDEQIKAGLGFLRRDQWGGENETVDEKNPAYGGFGYGSGQRPDMSNTNTTMDTLEALKQAGYLNEADPMFEKVRVFITRSQNLSEQNKDIETYVVGDDGGLIYTPALSPTKGGAESKAGEVALPGGKSGLRSYGSMTYAGFKSYLYSGLSKDDPRVMAAFMWIRKNYTLNENPGIGGMGLYYYYHTFARAFAAAGVARVADAANVAHDWRAELIDKLAGLQKPDGSWINEVDRWEEGNPLVSTCFAVLALEVAMR